MRQLILGAIAIGFILLLPQISKAEVWMRESNETTVSYAEEFAPSCAVVRARVAASLRRLKDSIELSSKLSAKKKLSTDDRKAIFQLLQRIPAEHADRINDNVLIKFMWNTRDRRTLVRLEKAFHSKLRLKMGDMDWVDTNGQLPPEFAIEWDLLGGRVYLSLKTTPEQLCFGDRQLRLEAGEGGSIALVGTFDPDQSVQKNPGVVMQPRLTEAKASTEAAILERMDSTSSFEEKFAVAHELVGKLPSINLSPLQLIADSLPNKFRDELVAKRFSTVKPLRSAEIFKALKVMDPKFRPTAVDSLAWGFHLHGGAIELRDVLRLLSLQPNEWSRYIAAPMFAEALIDFSADSVLAIANTFEKEARASYMSLVIDRITTLDLISRLRLLAAVDDDNFSCMSSIMIIEAGTTRLSREETVTIKRLAAKSSRFDRFVRRQFPNQFGTTRQ